MKLREMIDNKSYSKLKNYDFKTGEKFIGIDTPLTYAVKFSDTEMLEFLLECMLDSNLMNKDYLTPVMVAAKLNQLTMLEILVNHSGLISLQTISAKTALDLAREANAISVIDYLEKRIIDFREDYDEAISILESFGYRYLDALHLLKSNRFEWVKVYGDNVIIKLEDYFFVYWNQKITFEELYNQIGERATTFFIVDDEVRDEVLKLGKQLWMAECNHYYLDNLDNIEEVKEDFDELTEIDVEYMFANFKEAFDYDEEYVKLQVQIGQSTCLRKDGELIAWAFCHDDGSLGGLYVREEYRRFGYAKQISASIIRKVFNHYGTVYIDIKKDNYKSISLSEGIGFKHIRNTNWLEVTLDD